MLVEISARKDANLKDLKEEIKSCQAEMRSTLWAFWYKLKETIQRETRAIIQPIWAELNETTACNEVTGTKPGPGMMHSIEEHPEIPKVEATIMLVVLPRKRRRKSWIQEEVGCRLQKDVPPCKSVMVKKETLQESSDPGNMDCRRNWPLHTER
jgi:hypothetical protein